ncbi:hypothetical protein BDV23DRAFT_187202 [Aspergillus alliaceus]|uniref:Uncharacterized protein n=1 Tax=Petromyces alliaceus TaxID=209559 RepID=A0A5N7BXW0_PETAA|nr:hypothetical protein BDV23DRAFT_187202 [Aspergillus alliaceus]
MAAGTLLKDRRGTLLIMNRAKDVHFDEKILLISQDGEKTILNDHTQQSGEQKEVKEAGNIEYESMNPEVQAAVISARYRTELEGSGGGRGVTAGEEGGCINEHLPERFCRRCDGDCRNCLTKDKDRY